MYFTYSLFHTIEYIKSTVYLVIKRLKLYIFFLVKNHTNFQAQKKRERIKVPEKNDPSDYMSI